MERINEIIKAKEAIENKMICLASGNHGIFGYEAALKIAIELMEEKIEELENFGD